MLSDEITNEDMSLNKRGDLREPYLNEAKRHFVIQLE